MKKVVFLILLTLLLIVAAAASAPFFLSRPMEATDGPGPVPSAVSDPPSLTHGSLEPETEPEPEPVITTVTLSFVGDCMLATDRGGEWEGSFNLLAKQVEPSYFLENFAELFSSDDWTVANLENVFTDDPSIKTRAKGYTPAYWYRSGTQNTDILTSSSVEVLSLANNHCDDYGAKGLSDTRAALDDAGLIWGDNDNMIVLEKDGIRIALYCTTFYYTGYDTIITKKLAEVDADYRIVYFHGGTERVHVPDGWKAAGCRRMIDNGADLVIGGHPHVLQPVERYNGHTILHSLGNFCFGGSRSEENRTIVYRTTLTFTDGELTDTAEEIIPCYLYTELYKPGIITDEAEIDAVMSFLRGESDSPLRK